MFDQVGTGTVREMALAAAVGAGVLLGGAGFAAAETLSFFLEREGPEPVPASEIMSFQKFDPALGVLTGVNIAYTPGETTSYVSAFASITGGEFGFDSAVAATSASLFLFFGEVATRSIPGPIQTPSAVSTPLMAGETETATAECTTDGVQCLGVADSYGLKTMINPNPVLLTEQGDLDLFTGTGTVDLIAELVPFFSSSSSTPTGGQVGVGHSARWSGSVAVTYSYQAAVSTPEPASLVLFGSALGLAGLLRRRGRG